MQISTGHRVDKQRQRLLAVSIVPEILLIVPMAHKMFSAFAAQSTLFVGVLRGPLLSALVWTDY